ncbi:DUF1345 domain-containing protein [Nocardioides hwasunensis]|uniref:DUF1345 domain-containing protein n=1 Tax=Nocardioides hwasunensis TaxID=397258 RepID=A0ABR8MDW3_9ACTN|nr:DUF1345 domain-containing protein [Nocardioides hwasunensis]MBD3913735.1 DUF1345 domain-containing protein [Nocardioides hwasunensis]
MSWWQRETWRQTLACVGLVVGFFTPGEPLLVFLTSWDLYAVVYLVLTWAAIHRGGRTGLTAMARQSRRMSRAAKLFVASPEAFAQSAAVVALVSVLLVMPRADEQHASEPWVLAVCLVAIVSSWLVLQAGFLMTYVALHSEHGGLAFPDEARPGVVEYLYFTVAVGTTFGTTDVEVRKSVLRAQVLKHGVLAFVFNTLVLTVAITFTTNYLG